MALSNYSELKASIADWLARDDLTDRIPDFISLFEAFARREYGGAVLAVREDILTDAGEATVMLSETPRNIITISHSTGDDIRQSSQQEIMRMTPTSGRPRFWCFDTDKTIRFYPTPDAEYSLVMYKQANLDGLVSASESNYLLTNYPDVYLYGSLIQARQFLQDEALQQYEQRYAILDESLKRALSKQSNSASLGTCWSRGAPV